MNRFNYSSSPEDVKLARRAYGCHRKREFSKIIKKKDLTSIQHLLVYGIRSSRNDALTFIFKELEEHIAFDLQVEMYKTRFHPKLEELNDDFDKEDLELLKKHEKAQKNNKLTEWDFNSYFNIIVFN